jgi:dihydroorotate dehydrogenase
MYKQILKPLIFKFEAETAHDHAMRAAKLVSASSILQNLTKMLYGFEHPTLERKLWGINFKNPIGLAAGFDKNGLIVPGIEALGFGFTEVGSITANSSKGNPKPRAFRLPEDESLINRMGLNNHGAEIITERLKKVERGIPLGINIAKTHDPQIMGEKAIEDYLFSFNAALDVADYVTVNVSCPNTEEGKTFEDPTALRELLQALEPDRQEIPVLVKFSVDLELNELSELVGICEDLGVKGYVVTNTSSGRNGLKTSARRLEQIGRGGLSGAAITEKSTQIIRWLREDIKTDQPVIGVGGIHSKETAKQKLDAGADLLQIYTGLIYEGPGLVKSIKKGLTKN